MGASHEAGAVRVMVKAMQLGQAAGTAGALQPAGAAAGDVEPAALRSGLNAAGARSR